MFGMPKNLFWLLWFCVGTVGMALVARWEGHGNVWVPVVSFSIFMATQIASFTLPLRKTFFVWIYGLSVSGSGIALWMAGTENFSLQLTVFALLYGFLIFNSFRQRSKHPGP